MSEKSQETLERLRTEAEAEKNGDAEDLMDAEEEELILKAPDPEEKRPTTREYIILSSWKEAGRVEAGSAEDALKKLGKGEGSFVAVPERNWSAFLVKTETTTVTTVTPE